MALIYTKSVLVLSFLLYCSHFFGRALLGKKKDPIYSIGLGLGVLAHLFFFIGVLGFFKPAFLVSIVIASFVVTIPDQIKFWREKVGEIKFDWALAGVLFVLSVVPILLALCPPYAKDALVYHMFLPKQFLKWGKIVPVDGNVYSNFPLSVEMLFAVGVGLKLDVMCGLLSLSFYLLFLIQMYRLLKQESRWWAILGVFSLGAVPSLMVTAGFQYVDVATAFFCSLWAGAARDYIEGDSRSAPWLLGLFAGLAFSTKYIGGIFIIFAVLAWAIGSKRGDLKSLLFFGWRAGVGFLLFALPWLIKNAYYTKNPTYPFLYSLFDGVGWDKSRALAYSLHLHNFGVGRSVVDYLLLPINLVFKSEFETPRFDGKIGYLFLISFITFLIYFVISTLRFNKSAQDSEKFGFFCVVTSTFYFLFWAITSQQIRFLFPFFPVFWFSWLVPVARLKKNGLKQAAFIIVIILSLLGSVDVYKYLDGVRPWSYALGRESKDEFLTRMSKVYPCIKFINDNLSQDSYILMVQAGNRGYYMRRRFFSDSVFEYVLFKTIVKMSRTPDDVKANLRKIGFTHLLISEKYLYKAFEPSEQEDVKLVKDFFYTKAKLLFRHLTFSVYEITP